VTRAGRNWPTFEEIREQLEAWAREFPDSLQLETLAHTAGGRPLIAAKLSDRESDPEDKEHVLITANHSGARERTATTGILSLMRWLLSGEDLARETLQRQIVVCVPVGIPDSYDGELGVTNAHGLNPCNDWTLDGPVEPDHHPEGVAVQALMDRYQPEVHSDYHGLDLTFPGHFSYENSGASYGNSSLRSYHYGIIQLMDEAALEEGYPSDRLEQDGERLLWGPELDSISHKLWLGRPRVFAGMYCYNRYHSLVLHSEVYWERSGLLRHCRLLRVGNELWRNELWPGERYPGYPTRVVMPGGFNLVVAHGQTAAARRRSRVELWNKQRQIVHGQVNPAKEGQILYVCATTPQASQQWLGDRALRGVAQRLSRHPSIDTNPILPLVQQYPDYPGQWGAEANLGLSGGGTSDEEAKPIEHGLSLRLRIPYARASLGQVFLNGRAIQVSDGAGYETWVARGFTVLQINIPPATSRAEDLFVVTCEYDPGERRTQGLW